MLRRVASFLTDQTGKGADLYLGESNVVTIITGLDSVGLFKMRIRSIAHDVICKNKRTLCDYDRLGIQNKYIN